MALPAACTPAEGTYAAPAATAGGPIACGPGSTSSIGFDSTGPAQMTLDDGLTTTAGGVVLSSGTAQDLSATVVTGAGGGSIAGAAGQNGLYVVSSGGAVSINTGAGGLTIAGDNGVVANSGGAGAATVTGAANITANNGDGIQAGAIGGAVSVTTTGGAISATNDGINAFGAGAVTVSNAAAITGAKVAGISADGTAGTGTVSLTNSGAVTAGDAGVALSAAGGANVTVANTGAVTGGVGIQASTNSDVLGSTVSVTGSGAVTGTTGAGITLSSAPADTTGVVSLGASGAAYTGAISGATDGVEAHGGGAVNVYVGGAVTGAGSAAIVASSSGAGAVTVNASGGALTGGTGGIVASSTGAGTVSVINADTIAGGTGRGILATSSAGNVSVVSTGAITSGSQGILGVAGGSGTVTLSQDGNVTSGAGGVLAFTVGTGAATASYDAAGGNGTLTASGIVGVAALSSGGVATVNVGKVGATGTTTISATKVGVAALGGAGSTVVLGDKVTIDPDNYGVYAVSPAAVSVTSGDHDSITVDDNVVAGNDDKNYGVYAASLAASDVGATPSVSVALGTNNTIVVKDSGDGQADGGLGIAAINTAAGSGSVKVTVGNGVNINVTGNNAGGIGASTVFGGGAGSGSVSVSVGTGAITVTGGAAAGDTANNFPGSFGIAATTQGSGTVSVTNAAAITVSNNAAVGNRVEGVDAVTTGTGNVTVGNSGAIKALGSTAIGIDAAGGNGVTVTTSGAVSGGATGVLVNSGHGNTVTVTSTGSIRGLGTAAHAALDVTTGTSAGDTANITNGGLIASNSATTALQAADTAIALKGGNVILVNSASGTINGLIDVSGLTTAGGAGSTVSLTNAGTWNLAGTETLSPNNDAVLNSGTINTLGTSVINLGAGANSFTNTGTIKVGGVTAGSAAASLTVSGITTLNNSGVIDVHDGAANRSFATTATLAGSGGSQLYVDASLGGPGSLASAVTIGGSSGLTSIRVNNINAGMGAYIPNVANGIVLVTGATSLSNFRLDPASTGANGAGIPTGVTNAIAAPGLFFYDLAANGNKIVLISAPKVEALQFAQVGALAGDTWSNTTQSWFDRQADLRETLGDRALGSAPAVWMRITGDWSRRDSAETLTAANGTTYGYDTSYRTDSAAVIAGVDLLHGVDKSQAWVVGVQGGYVDTNARFRTSGTRLNLTGGIVGVYASYLRGGLFVDGIVNGNILTGEWNLPSLGATTAPWDASSHVNTWGGQLEAGYSLPIGASSFVEPLGSIAYGRTTTGALALPGATQNFADADTLRGSLGGRIGTTAAYQYYKVKVALEGRVWDEFDGKTNTLLANGGANFLNGADISGVYGEIKGEANLFAAGNNLSAFVNTGIKWKSRYQDTSVSLGVRYQW
ncbi:beta strand repeat-containing protein [Caulobacter sp. KR2-114]|uniref:beta strand repeat-containing protein n=1 Tax=Caulobacter sp. KR2-114 TaxID=3400912 RepID=UPI003C01B17E